MDQLIKVVVEKTRLSEEDARAAVEAVVGSLMERLPGRAASALSNVLGSGTEGQGGGDRKRSKTSTAAVAATTAAVNVVVLPHAR